jgi:hypothetical protein
MKRKPVPPQQRHADHPVEVRTGTGPHVAQLWCQRCRKHIQWITQAQADILKATPDESRIHSN